MRLSCAGLARITSNELRRRGNEPLRRDSGGGAGQANPSQACPRVCPATESKPRGYGARVRTMWAQNTLLIETANARDVARCGVAVQKKNPRARPGGFQLVGDEGA